MSIGVVEGLKWLPKYGLTVEFYDGWETRGYANQKLVDVRGILNHHTATGRTAFGYDEAPTVWLCINGRSDLPGPLCQIVLGRTGIVHVIASGVGNHAGMGSAPGVPENAGNHYLIGIEAESSGVVPWDWTEDQLRVLPYLNKALMDIFNVTLVIGHKEYSYQGKIDPAGWPGDMDGLRAQVDAVNFETDDGFGKPGIQAPIVNEVEDLANVTAAQLNRLMEASDRVMGAIPPGPHAHRGKELNRLLDNHDGSFIVGKIESNTAVVQSLVGAIKAVSAGEKFDEAKLLASIEERVGKAIRENAVEVSVNVDKKEN